MPIIYTEEKQGHKSVFSKIIIDQSGEETLEQKVSMPMFIRERAGFTWFILYDDKMNPNKDFFEYMNFTLQETSPNTRRATAFALRLLYCFLALTGYGIRELGEERISELVRFLRGINSNPVEYASVTQRSANTVNGYLSVYRVFFAKRHISCDALFDAKLVNMTDVNADGFTSNIQRKRYTSNVKVPDTTQRYVPKYISPVDFKILYTLAIRKEDKVTAVLMHLMYGYGLRPGEALGITIEDVQEVEWDHELIPVIILRNRLSDEPYQFAKGLPHVMTGTQYGTKDYKRAKWVVQITYDMFDAIMDYLETVHTEVMKNRPDNYAMGIADRVDTYNEELEENHYVFLNRYGKPLSLQTLNNHLRAFFKEAGIPVDADTRENNLAHRFRHGFAMFQAHFRDDPVDQLELQKMMRHKRLTSTSIYYNPTPQDEYEIRTAAQNDLYTLIPELRKGATYLGSL